MCMCALREGGTPGFDDSLMIPIQKTARLKYDLSNDPTKRTGANSGTRSEARI